MPVPRTPPLPPMKGGKIDTPIKGGNIGTIGYGCSGGNQKIGMIGSL